MNVEMEEISHVNEREEDKRQGRCHVDLFDKKLKALGGAHLRKKDEKRPNSSRVPIFLSFFFFSSTNQHHISHPLSISGLHDIHVHLGPLSIIFICPFTTHTTILLPYSYKRFTFIYDSRG